MAWQINYSNSSSNELELTDVGGVTQAVLSSFTHQPASPMDAGSKDYLELDQNAFKIIASGDVDFYQGIYYNGSCLWVRIHVPVEVFTFGTYPYWYYMTNDGTDPTLENGAWKKHKSDSVNDTFSNMTVKFSPVIADENDMTLSVGLDDQI